MREKENHNKSEIKILQERIHVLEEQLSIYETAASGANDGLWDWDFVKNRPFVSKPWKTMLGIDANEVAIGIWESLLHPDDFQRATNYFKNFEESNELKYQQEFRLRHTDGSYRWILSKATAVRNDSGKMLRLSGSHTDITQRKESTEALEYSEEKYHTLFENSLVGMFRTDYTTGKILESNNKFWEIVGPDRRDKQTIIDFYKDENDRNYILDLIKEHGKVENVELEIRRLDGKLIWVAFSVKYYPEEGFLEKILVDITETKHNLLELQKVNFELDSFVYHASHDLRSPLRSVLGLIELYHLEKSEEIKAQCIDRISTSITRLDDLIQELLSLSRNDRVNDELEEINLINEINNSVDSYFNASDTKNLQIITKVHHQKKLQSDLTRVRIILNNIISNAIKYRSFNREESYIKIKAEVLENQALITIEDNGEGIEKSKLPNIFDMFYRATEQSVGSGLGLYIVKKVAEKLNATIKVESKELEGTTFTITIPNSYYTKK